MLEDALPVPKYRKTVLELQVGPELKDSIQENLSAGFERYAFYTLDSKRPLCQNCLSLFFRDMISAKGAKHSEQGKVLKKNHDDENGCPLCTIFWSALLRHVVAQDAPRAMVESSSSLSALDNFFIPSNNYASKDECLALLVTEPVHVFINPLCAQDQVRNPGTLPYQISELSVRSSLSDGFNLTDPPESLHNWPGPVHLFDASHLSVAWEALVWTPEEAQLSPNLALTRATFVPSTSWSK